MIKIMLFTNSRSYGVFAGFSSLLYLSPLIGGYCADKLIGSRLAIVSGGLLLTLGYSLLAVSHLQFFYAGLAIIVAGSGLFIPNIATMVGQLYDKNSGQREAGFSIFYASINVGALIPPMLISFVIVKFGWQAGFLLASVNTFISTVLIWFVKYHNNDVVCEINAPHKIGKKYYKLFLWIVMLIGSSYILIKEPDLSNVLVIALGAGLFLVAYINSFKYSSVQKNRLNACLILTTFSIVFEMLFQQSAMSLTMFIEYYVKRDLNSLTIPTVFFQAFNPVFVIMLAPIFSRLWVFLDTRNNNPSIPSKFAYGTLLMGIAFMIFPYALSYATEDKICIYWIIVSYFLQSCGELLISPIGLAMMTEMVPRSMNGIMLGIWYFSIAIANSLAGIISQWTVVPDGVKVAKKAASFYTNTYGQIGLISIITALIILALVPRLKKMINGNYEKETIETALSNLDLISS